MSNLVLIAAVEAEEAARAAGGTLEDRLRAAMKAMTTHWLVTQEDDQFNAAMEGTYRTCDDDEKARLKVELRLLQTVGAMMSGVPVDFSQLDEGIEPIGALAMWREVRS